MHTIKKMLVIFIGDTLVMLVSWAGLSVILFCIRVISARPVALINMLSVSSFLVATFCYAFFLTFDLWECTSTLSRSGRTEPRRLEESTKGYLESKRFLNLVFTRVIKVITVCLVLTSAVWLVGIGKFTFGAFLAGAALGFLVFWMFGFLKRYLGYQQVKESPAVTEKMGRLPDPEGIKPTAPVED